MVYGIFRMERIQAAEKYFPADLLYDDYVYIPINRRYKLIIQWFKTYGCVEQNASSVIYLLILFLLVSTGFLQ